MSPIGGQGVFLATAAIAVSVCTPLAYLQHKGRYGLDVGVGRGVYRALDKEKGRRTSSMRTASWSGKSFLA